MKVVVDTNVMLGAVLGAGAANAVIAACLKGECIPLMGNALFTEYEDVFSREELFGNGRLTLEEREELLDIFFACCEWTRVYYLWRPNLRDEADNHLVELAVAGGAQFIVTRNLRDVGRGTELRFSGLKVVSPDAFLKEI
jgi:putative PIN family toxin of toxin-antitoxin system